MVYALQRFCPTSRFVAALAVVVCSLAMGLALAPGSAEAAVQPCVKVTHHWPFTDVMNGCSEAKRVVLHFWSPPWWYHDSDCLEVGPGQTKTWWNAAPSSYVGADPC
jgi:hypothetical protein